ncbi:Tripartite-type tricarboxylate transporter, receptor component TctC [Natronorubrum sediminis]|uniref:Tripartite-type tricarboxylate transporter, receptor component TctC n=2 Tax=Natronorubrum sediminis TaxID=640943 RepID=A0A1H6G748_9EURY|nr:Tripartite-type tricarboxylate transporter, receptor component TctC [Natronorubrum sediminis]
MAGNNRRSRRTVLKYGGAAGMVGLAGCADVLGGGGSDDVRVIVPYSEGGGTDIYARQLAPVMAEELDVSVEIDNVVGSGTIQGMNELYQADTDGSTVGVINGPSILYIMRPDLLEFDYLDFESAGAFARTVFVISAHPDDDIDDYQDLVDRYQDGEFTEFGGLTIGEGQWLVANLMRDIHGLEFESYVAYSSSGELAQANASEEIPSGNPTETTLEEFIGDELLEPVVATASDGSPTLPDVPTFEDEGFDPLPYGDFSRGLLFPPDTDEDILEEWEAALETAVESEEIQDWSDDSGNMVEFNDREWWQEEWTEGPERIEAAIEEEASVEDYRDEVEEDED